MPIIWYGLCSSIHFEAYSKPKYMSFSFPLKLMFGVFFGHLPPAVVIDWVRYMLHSGKQEGEGVASTRFNNGNHPRETYIIVIAI